MNLPTHEVTLSYARSSGPGGQNVNKTNTKVILKWNVIESVFLTHNYQPFVRLNILNRYKNFINSEGELVLHSDQFRDQIQNKKKVFDKLKNILQECSHVPKKRIKTRISRAKKEKRIHKKRRHSDKKKLRTQPVY